MSPINLASIYGNYLNKRNNIPLKNYTNSKSNSSQEIFSRKVQASFSHQRSPLSPFSKFSEEDSSHSNTLGTKRMHVEITSPRYGDEGLPSNAEEPIADVSNGFMTAKTKLVFFHILLCFFCQWLPLLFASIIFAIWSIFRVADSLKPRVTCNQSVLNDVRWWTDHIHIPCYELLVRCKSKIVFWLYKLYHSLDYQIGQVISFRVKQTRLETECLCKPGRQKYVFSLNALLDLSTTIYISGMKSSLGSLVYEKHLKM